MSYWPNTKQWLLLEENNAYSSFRRQAWKHNVKIKQLSLDKTKVWIGDSPSPLTEKTYLSTELAVLQRCKKGPCDFFCSCAYQKSK